jgi:hypothetical protein
MDRRALLASSAWICACHIALAQQQACYTGSVPLQQTSWSASVSLPMFDPALGTLQQIGFTFDAGTSGTVEIENLDASPIVAQVQFSTFLTLTRPNLSTIAVANPTYFFQQNFAAFDGTIDFAGTSGSSLFPTSAASVQAVSPPPASDLSMFTGAGTITLPVTAVNASSFQGGGNYALVLSQQASATVTVCYTYQPNASVSLAYCFGDGTSAACPCGNLGAAGNGCASSVNASGANLSTTGTASVAADSFVLHGSGMTNSVALYIQGSTQVDTAFGDGKRCVGGSVIRLGTKSNVNGVSEYPSGSLPISVKGMVSSGSTRNYQVWYRNVDPMFCTPSTFNLSNGVSVTWLP